MNFDLNVFEWINEFLALRGFGPVRTNIWMDISPCAFSTAFWYSLASTIKAGWFGCSCAIRARRFPRLRPFSRDEIVHSEVRILTRRSSVEPKDKTRCDFSSFLFHVKQVQNCYFYKIWDKIELKRHFVKSLSFFFCPFSPFHHSVQRFPDYRQT